MTVPERQSASTAMPGQRAQVTVEEVGPDELAATPVRMRSSGARLADFFATLDHGRVILRLVYGQEPEGGYRIVECRLEEWSYPELADVEPAAFVEECEIYEHFGVRPEGGRALNRVVAPPHTEAAFPRLGPVPGDYEAADRAPHYVAGDAFEFPVGPVRGVAQESLYTGLVTSGEELIELYLLQWHKHRGVERRCQGVTAERALFLVERVEGLSAVGNSWAFCQAVETCAGIEVSPAAERSRGIALELERLYNHAAALAALAQATGLSVGQAQAEIALEQFMRLNAAAFGHRYLFGVLGVGGARKAPEPDAIRRLLPTAYGELCRVVDALRRTNSFVDRLEATGVVTPETARRLGLVGPVGRASGQALDVRADHPFGPYTVYPVSASARSAGDVLARMEVMVEEAERSAQLIRAMVVDGAGEGTEELEASGDEAALGRCESSRGECLAWVAMDGPRVNALRLRPAAVRNWRAFDDAARSGNVFTDLPIIEASFWLTVAGFAR